MDSWYLPVKKLGSTGKLIPIGDSLVTLRLNDVFVPFPLFEDP
ncbi:hypothetical protein EYZ11_003541 [Aspergillus tanneri]|uniref:Uncharacterized protein n=1 Tax=Aspergillus tanneri TaxID=1220188 RepID=A0A4S3JN86_9EURO|nr:hypothetical protein EYZ11_003541 [Aspergillus tanneri]